MSPQPSERPLFVVVYPYKFTDFVYHLLELDDFKRHCDVQVWDISALTTPKFSRAVSAERSRQSGVVAVTTWRQLLGRLHDVRARSASTPVCILNEVPCTSAAEAVCNWLMSVQLRRTTIAVLDLLNGGTPLRYLNQTSDAAPAARGSVWARGLRFARGTTTLTEARRKLSTAVFGLLNRVIPTSTTHRLVAGEDWLQVAQTRSGRRRRPIALVYGHSHDYSTNLAHRLRPSLGDQPGGRIAVLLDGPGPMFASDLAHNGRKAFFTTDVWYPALARLFDRLEADTGVRVEIAGHYKSRHPSVAPCFGNRRVHYGRTAQMVRFSEFVITRTSTAISHAVIARKPVLFIYSNQLEADSQFMRDIRGMAAMLGTTPINIDTLPADIRSLLRVDEERYRHYERMCLTSAGPSRPNVQIILEDVMGLATGADFAWTETARTSA
jgi:hypothetical protein